MGKPEGDPERLEDPSTETLLVHTSNIQYIFFNKYNLVSGEWFILPPSLSLSPAWVTGPRFSINVGVSVELIRERSNTAMEAEEEEKGGVPYTVPSVPFFSVTVVPRARWPSFRGGMRSFIRSRPRASSKLRIFRVGEKPWMAEERRKDLGEQNDKRDQRAKFCIFNKEDDLKSTTQQFTTSSKYSDHGLWSSDIQYCTNDLWLHSWHVQAF